MTSGIGCPRFWGSRQQVSKKDTSHGLGCTGFLPVRSGNSCVPLLHRRPWIVCPRAMIWPLHMGMCIRPSVLDLRGPDPCTLAFLEIQGDGENGPAGYLLVSYYLNGKVPMGPDLSDTDTIFGRPRTNK